MKSLISQMQHRHIFVISDSHSILQKEIWRPMSLSQLLHPQLWRLQTRVNFHLSLRGFGWISKASWFYFTSQTCHSCTPSGHSQQGPVEAEGDRTPLDVDKHLPELRGCHWCYNWVWKLLLQSWCHNIKYIKFKFLSFLKATLLLKWLFHSLRVYLFLKMSIWTW